MTAEDTQIVAVPGIVHPVTPPVRATHFRLIKGGLNGVTCRKTTDLGITVDQHPINLFDRDTITGLWGFDGHFVVQFFVEYEPGKFRIQGAPKHFGLEGEAESEERSEVVTSYSGRNAGGAGDMGGAIAALASLRQIVNADASASIEANRLHFENSLAATRDAHKVNLELMGMILQSHAAPKTDPVLAQVLVGMVESQKATNALLARFVEPDEDEPDDVSDEEAEREELKNLVHDVRRHGMGALTGYAKAKGVEALIDMLPALKEQLPAMAGMLMSFFQAKMAELSAPPAVQSVPTPTPVPEPTPEPIESSVRVE